MSLWSYAEYKPRFVHTRQTRSLSVEFEGEIYSINLEEEEEKEQEEEEELHILQSKSIVKRHGSYSEEEEEEAEEDHPEDGDGIKAMFADGTNTVGQPDSVKVTHK